MQITSQGCKVKKLIIFFIAISLSLSVTAQELEDLISFNAHDLDSSFPDFSLSTEKLDDILNNSYSVGYGEIKTRFKVEKVDSLPKGALFSIKPVLEGKDSYIRVAVTESGLKSAGASAELCSYAFTVATKFKNGLGWMEAITNARMGSIVSLQSLAELRLLAIDILDHQFNLDNFINDPESFKQALKEKSRPKLEASFKALEKSAKEELKIKKTKFELRKQAFDELDNSSNQFKDLIAQNDRKGVAKLIETYLPWEYMEPIEEKFWRQWLEAVKDPVPVENRIFMYRGLDKGQSFINEAGETFLMPPVIIKNQGSYNRRLRSLTTMLDKSISENPQFRSHDDKGVTKILSRSSRVSNQLQNHAADPLGSPHMSFTKDIFIAQNFGNGKVGVFAIDPRLVTPNAMSKYSEEVELLASMAVFPDESIGIIDTTNGNLSTGELKKKAKLLLEERLGAEEAERIWNREFSPSNPLSMETSFTKEARRNYVDWLLEVTQSSCSHHLSN